MDQFKERFNLPSSSFIAEKLNLTYEGEYQQANPDASFSHPLPVITDDAPNKLSYLPLNILSKYALQDKISQEDLMEKLKGKKFCVIICNSFDIVDSSGERIFYTPDNFDFSYIAGFWDTTEDPFHMGPLLSSCSVFTKPDNVDGVKKPCFLKPENISRWLSEELPLESKMKACI